MLKSPWWKGSQESVASSTRFRFRECSSDRIIPSFILSRLFSRCRNLAWTRPPKRHYARITRGDSWERPPAPVFPVSSRQQRLQCEEASHETGEHRLAVRNVSHSPRPSCAGAHSRPPSPLDEPDRAAATSRAAEGD